MIRWLRKLFGCECRKIGRIWIWRDYFCPFHGVESGLPYQHWSRRP